MKRLGITDANDGSRTLVWKNNGNDTLTALRQQRQERSLCDITLKVEDIEILAHKNILAINSPYFRAMFVDGFSEASAGEVRLPSEIVDKQSAESLVDFMYTGQLSMTANNVQSLITAADLWQMTEVKMACVDYMERLIDENNCLGILVFAEMYQCEELGRWCLCMIKQRFPLVVQSAEFLQLSEDRLTDILSLTDLTLGFEGENVVLKAVFRWLDYNSSGVDQVSQVSRLLKKVNLAATSKDCRELVLGNHHLVVQSAEVQELIQKLTEEPEQVVRHAQTALYVIGGFLQSRTGPKCPRLQSVEKLDDITKKWTSCADLPMLSSGSVAFSVHGHLLCCCFMPVTLPDTHAIITRTGLFEYNFIRNEWSDAMPNFSSEALGHLDSCLQAEGAVAVCDRTGSVYTVSKTEVMCLSVDLIDGDIDCRDVRYLPRPPSFTQQQRLHSAIVVCGRLYVLGGDRHDAGSDPVATSRVMVFDPEFNQWVSCADMLEPRVKMSVVQLNGQIYANGGFNIRRLATMERYDPKTNKWTAVKAMNKYRSHHQALVLNNKIWAIGGKSYAFNNGGARKVLNLCEVYDPDTDTWTEVPEQSMIHARCAFAAVAL